MQTTDPEALVESEPRLPAGTKLGVWKLDALIGFGGMGEVYRAQRADGRYEQTVAIKILRPGNPGWRERFELERSRLATLDHPSVSRLIDGGDCDDGRPYMAMELVDGSPISEFTQAKRLPQIAVIELMIAVCDVVGYAHGKLILHRDLKPANILVDQEGRIRLIDFGVSALLNEDQAHHPAPVTAAYCAPEQVRGDPLSVATDIFALGAVLNQLLTGQPPTRADDAGLNVPGHTLGHTLDTDLVAVLKKAHAADPAERYLSASALAADLRAFVERQPVAARNGGRLYRAGRLLRRYRVVNALVASLFLALTGGVIVSLGMADRANQARDRAEFFLAQANQAGAVESAYVDILDRVFTTEDDTARIRKVMLERASQALDHSRQSPETAAEISFVIGAHFLNAYDYQNARRVLEPWIEAGFGGRSLLRRGRLTLADAYNALGETDRAIALLRQVEADFDHPLERLSEDYRRFAFDLAYATESPRDVTFARQLFEQALQQPDVGPELRLRSLHSLQFLAKESGDFDRAYELLQEASAIYDANPLMDLSGWGPVHIHLASYELFHKNNLKRAEALTRAIVEFGDKHGSPDDTAYRFLALLHMQRGEFREAETALTQASEIESRFLGDDRFARHVLIELRAEQRQFAAGQQEIQALLSNPSIEPDPSDAHPRLALASAYLTALAGKPQDAEKVLADLGFTRAEGLVEPGRRFRMERLERMGVAIPD